MARPVQQRALLQANCALYSLCSSNFQQCLKSTNTRAVGMSGETTKFVKDAISKDSVVIFSKTYCPYCKMAKEVFDKLHHKFTAIELDNRDDGDSIQEVLGDLTGARSVPRVFVNGEFIGGGTDVKALYESGKLEKMLVPASSAQ